MLSVIMLRRTFIYCYAECHYAKSRYAECFMLRKIVKINKIIKKLTTITNFIFL
jgi:hypothetical protein